MNERYILVTRPGNFETRIAFFDCNWLDLHDWMIDTFGECRSHEEGHFEILALADFDATISTWEAL